MDKVGKSASPWGDGDSPRYPLGLLLPFLVVILLNLVGFLFPSISTWGFNIWGSFHPALFISLIALFGLCSIPSVAEAISGLLTSLVSRLENLSIFLRIASTAIISLIVGALFVLLRSDSPIYGDGYTVVANSIAPIFAPPETFHETIKIVPVLIYRIGAALLTKQMHLDPRLAFGIVSSIGGVVGFWGLWHLARSVGKNTAQAVALMAAGLASGCTVLFFGHLELYTWAIAVLVWLLASAIDFVNGNGSARTVWIWLVVAAAMQALFLPTLLVIVITLLTLRRDTDVGSPVLGLGLSPARIGWGILCCSIAAGLFFTIVPTGFSFVPVWGKSANPYSVFSLAHFADILNLIILAAPLVLVPVLWNLFSRREVAGRRLELGKELLGLCVLSLFLVSFWLDPGLGAVRDWDLLSFFGFPAGVFAGLLMLRRFRGATAVSLLTSLSLCLILLVPGPHIIERTNGERALTRIDPMVWQDAHYLPSYDGAHGALPWAALVQTFTKQPQLADRYLWRKIGVDSTDALSWFNLGEIELNRKRNDSAAVMFEKAHRLIPGSEIYLTRYAQVLQEKGDRERLQELLPLLGNLQSNDQKVLGYAGIILGKEGKLSEAVPLFKRAYLLRPWEYQMCMNLAMAYYQLEQYDSSSAYFQKALPILPQSDRPNAFRALIQGEIRSNRLENARAALAEFRRQFPNEPSLDKIQALLDRQK